MTNSWGQERANPCIDPVYVFISTDVQYLTNQDSPTKRLKVNNVNNEVTVKSQPTPGHMQPDVQEYYTKTISLDNMWICIIWHFEVLSKRGRIFVVACDRVGAVGKYQRSYSLEQKNQSKYFAKSLNGSWDSRQDDNFINWKHMFGNITYFYHVRIMEKEIRTENGKTLTCISQNSLARCRYKICAFCNSSR